jgi:cytochrome c oxidase cbb3-type subunit IV
MDINVIRSILTVLSFAAFLGIVFWAWSAKRKAAFDEAANLPFVDDQGGDDGDEKTGAANSFPRKAPEANS